MAKKFVITDDDTDHLFESTDIPPAFHPESSRTDLKSNKGVKGSQSVAISSDQDQEVAKSREALRKVAKERVELPKVVSGGEEMLPVSKGFDTGQTSSIKVEWSQKASIDTKRPRVVASDSKSGQAVAKGINQQDIPLLLYLAQNEREDGARVYRYALIAEDLGTTYDTIKSRMHRLIKRGLVENLTPEKSGRGSSAILVLTSFGMGEITSLDPRVVKAMMKSNKGVN